MAKPKVARKKTSAPQQAVARLYCQGIGDCHLLTFRKDDGSDFRMLIDCGIHTSIAGGREIIDDVVEDLTAACDGQLDVIVGTHEHWDHLSGFYTAREAFEKIKVGEVWLGWTEDPDDPQAQALDAYKGQALAALQSAQARLAAKCGENDYLVGVRDGVEGLMGFQFGLKGEKTRATRDALLSLASKVKYLEPGPKPISIKGLPNLRIYVLGPPRDEALIGVRIRKSEMYHMAGGWPVADALGSALNAVQFGHEDRGAPFDLGIGADLESMLAAAPGVRAEDAPIINLLDEHYKAEPRRRIDSDWLAPASDLAIQLDSKTNNSSLVLAFEFVDSGRVLLFAADAQVGNWLSWQDLSWKVDQKVVTGPELLARTVFYKVGHHGSENATLKEKGLELMTDEDLSAFIPTNQKNAKAVGWGEMPFHLIVDDLHKRAGRRVIRADDEWIAGSKTAPGFRAPSGSIRKIQHGPGLWVELELA